MPFPNSFVALAGALAQTFNTKYFNSPADVSDHPGLPKRAREGGHARTLEKAAWAVPGVRSVEDHLRIS